MKRNTKSGHVHLSENPRALAMLDKAYTANSRPSTETRDLIIKEANISIEQYDHYMNRRRTSDRQKSRQLPRTHQAEPEPMAVLENANLHRREATAAQALVLFAGDGDPRSLIQGPSNEDTSDAGKKRKIAEMPESSTEASDFDIMQYYKTKCIELHSKVEKKTIECIQIRGELEDLKRRLNAEKEGTEYWRSMYAHLECRVVTTEVEISKLKFVEHRVSELESLILRNRKGNV